MRRELVREEGRLFPYFVCRIAGLPAGHLDVLRATASLSAHREVRRLEGELEKLREPLVEALFEAVGGLEDRASRNALLELKRAVHNLRRIRDADLRRIEGRVGEPLVAELHRFRDLFAARHQADAQAREAFHGEIAGLRRRFQELVSDETFRMGILLSTPTLFDEMRRYLRASPEKLGSKARQVERSLMRYFSRTAAKTTPFSTLCALAPGRLGAGPGAGELRGDPRRKRRGLRLNKGIYGFLADHFQRRPAIRRRLDVELNPTLRDEDATTQVFLTAVEGREVFQRLPRQPVLDLLRGLLAERPHRPCEDLLEALRTHPEVEATDEEAAAYVDRLLDIGFLRFRIGIREQEVDWDRPLAAILGAVDDPHAARIVRFLLEYREVVDAYARATAAEACRELLADASRLVAELFDELEAVHRPPAVFPPFYEDAGGEVRLELDLEPLQEVLSEWVRLTAPVVWMRGEQAEMRAFYDRHYGGDPVGDPVGDPGGVELLRFYEDFYREHFKGHLERLRAGSARAGGEASPQEAGADEEGTAEVPGNTDAYDASNPFQLEVIRRIDEARLRLVKRLRELWRADPEAEEIRLERSDLEDALAEVPAHPEPCRSVSFFVQYLPSLNGVPALVGNSYLGGYGKYFSRFLHVLPEEIAEALRAANLELTDHDLAEICGDANFNANLHPPLLPREVSYPTGESGAAAEQIRTSELRLEPDPDNPYRLRLRHAGSGREVIPVDLGFLNPRMRPPLYQLLARCSPCTNYALTAPFLPAGPEEPTAEPPAVVYRPRITYRGRLVAARRQWQVDGALLPRRGAKESEAEHFLRLQRWREELDLPGEVFVRVRPLAFAAPDRRQVREHLYKPQYVDFANPFLVDLLSRAGENLERFQLTFEERLPGREHLPASGEDRWVTELVVQLDFPGRGEERHGAA